MATEQRETMTVRYTRLVIDEPAICTYCGDSTDPHWRGEDGAHYCDRECAEAEAADHDCDLIIQEGA